MNVSMKVADAGRRKVAKKVDLGGGVMGNATVDAMQAQLVSDIHGTMTMNFTGDEMAAAEAVFVEGANVTVTFAKA